VSSWPCHFRVLRLGASAARGAPARYSRSRARRLPVRRPAPHFSECGDARTPSIGPAVAPPRCRNRNAHRAGPAFSGCEPGPDVQPPWRIRLTRRPPQPKRPTAPGVERWCSMGCVPEYLWWMSSPIDDERQAPCRLKFLSNSPEPAGRCRISAWPARKTPRVTPHVGQGHPDPHPGDQSAGDLIEGALPLLRCSSQSGRVIDVPGNALRIPAGPSLHRRCLLLRGATGLVRPASRCGMHSVPA